MRRRGIKKLTKFADGMIKKKHINNSRILTDKETLVSEMIKAAGDLQTLRRVCAEESDSIMGFEALFTANRIVKYSAGRSLNYRQYFQDKSSINKEDKKTYLQLWEKIVAALNEIEGDAVLFGLQLAWISGELQEADEEHIWEQVLDYFVEKGYRVSYVLLLKNLQIELAKETSSIERQQQISKILSDMLLLKEYASDDHILTYELLVTMLACDQSSIDAIKVLEKYISINYSASVFTTERIIGIFKAYYSSNVKRGNLAVLSLISNLLVRKIDQLGLRELRDVLYYLGKLKYDNQVLLAAINKLLFNELTHYERVDPNSQIEGEYAILQNEVTGELQKDTTNLLFANLSKAQRSDYLSGCLYNMMYLDFKGEELFNLIMLELTSSLEDLPPKILQRLVFCHSKFSFNRLRYLEENRHLYYKRAQKKVIQMNDSFYLMIIPVVKEQIALMDPLDMISIASGSLRPGVKKREVKRQLFDLNISMLEEIHNRLHASNNLDQTYREKLRKAYFQISRLSTRHVLKDEMQQRLTETLQNHGANMTELDAQYGMFQIGD